MTRPLVVLVVLVLVVLVLVALVALVFPALPGSGPPLPNPAPPPPITLHLGGSRENPTSAAALVKRPAENRVKLDLGAL
ncbi:hypothetical protein BDN67DRAFT_1016723 [Paxillus ammoniavirescens]|nr:hypothetical protein BDN67DRAFT_1016723 [Paxillus ammoniavirescens]